MPPDWLWSPSSNKDCPKLEWFKLSPSTGPWPTDVQQFSSSSLVYWTNDSSCPDYTTIWPSQRWPSSIPPPCDRRIHALRDWLQWWITNGTANTPRECDQTWIKHLWVSTQENGITILMDFVDYLWQRSGDIKLMQLFVQNGWKQLELKALSHCQMYLKMFLLSDIVLGSRVEISMQFWEWYHLADSSLDWPCANKPTPHLWYLWKTALMDALHLGRNQRLATPLGKWWHNNLG